MLSNKTQPSPSSKQHHITGSIKCDRIGGVKVIVLVPTREIARGFDPWSSQIKVYKTGISNKSIKCFSCKSNHHTITTTMAPIWNITYLMYHVDFINVVYYTSVFKLLMFMILKSLSITFLTFHTRIPSRATTGKTQDGDVLITGPMDTTCNYAISYITFKKKIHYSF